MYIKINPPEKYNNKGSCTKLAEYLDKENDGLELNERQMFFNQDRDDVSIGEVINRIDNNKARLGKEETKFFMLSINPSERELKHICREVSGREISDIEQLTSSEKIAFENSLKEYSRVVMDLYGRNFNKGLEGKDILYYGKVEHIRTFKRDSNKLIEDRLKHIKLQENDLDKIAYCKTYYGDAGTQNLAHGLKEGKTEAIQLVAKEMVEKIPDNAILVPMPSSCGYATYTKALSEEIKKINPSLDVSDILKCNEREKLYELKKMGYEANEKYFNFYLSGSVPKDREIYLVDNVLSTGTTFVHAKQAIPDAKLVVYGINEETSIKKVKLDQLHNLQKDNLPKIGDKKVGLQSHVHIIVSRKDITNTIKISPMANAKNSLNKLPDGSLAQIGFDRKKFVNDAEKAFDKEFNYKREFKHSFEFHHLVKNQMNNLTKNISMAVLPEEMRTIGKNSEKVMSILAALDKGDSNHAIANMLHKDKKIINQFSASADVFRVQGVAIPLEFKNPNPFLSAAPANVRVEYSILNKQLVSTLNEQKIVLEDLNKEIRTAHANNDFLSVKTLRIEKEKIAAPYHAKISSLKQNIDKLFKDNSIFVDSNKIVPFNDSHLTKLNAISKEFLSISSQLDSIHKKTQFLSNHKKATSFDLYHNINDLKNSQYTAYGVVRKLDQINGELAIIKSDLFSSIRVHKSLIDAQIGSIERTDPLAASRIETLKAPHAEVKKDILNKVDLLSRAQIDIQFQKANIIESTKVISNAQRAQDPLELLRSTFSNVPVAKEAIQAISYAYNPAKLGLDIVKKSISAVINAGMNI